jgi:CDGSH-type Zn-finger protein
VIRELLYYVQILLLEKEILVAERTNITILKDGPMRIQGDIVVKDADGNEFDLAGRDVSTLCRCGHSENKPFCDGSHKRTGFQSEVKAK